MNQAGSGALPQDRMQAIRAGLQGSLSRTLLLIFLGLALVPLLILGGITFYLSQEQITSQLRGQLISSSVTQAGQINNWIDDRQTTVALIASEPDVLDSARFIINTLPSAKGYDEARSRLLTTLNAATRKDAQFYAFLLVDRTNYTVLVSTDPNQDNKMLAQKQIFDPVGQNGGYRGDRAFVTLPGFDDIEPILLKDPFMMVSEPINSVNNGAPIGMLVGLVRLDRLNHIIENSVSDGLTEGLIYVVDGKKRLIALNQRTDKPITHSVDGKDVPWKIGDKVDADSITRVTTHDAHQQIVGEIYTNFSGELVFGHANWYAYGGKTFVQSADVEQDGLGVFIEQPQAVAFAGLINFLVAIGLSVLVVGAIVAALAVAVSRNLVRPIQSLTQSAVAVAAGDLDRTVEIRRDDELGVLANAFNAMTGELKTFYADLEQKVAARTKDLEDANGQIIRRALQLQTSAEVAQAATSILEVDMVLERVVNLVRERFGFYHVQVFLLDAEGRYAVLRASTGEVGRELLARKHRLGVGSQSLIGYVSQNRVAHVAMDVADDPFHRFNPLLPDTRAELAIPLVAGEQLLGALDVQSTDVDAFGTDDVALFESLAAQISVAIENARLYQEAQRLARRERLLKEFTARVRSTTDIEQIAILASESLGRALGATHAVVRVGGAGPATPTVPATPILPAESGGNGTR